MARAGDIERFPEGVESEAALGFTRVVRAGQAIIAGGTTARSGATTAYEQTVEILQRVLPLIEKAGGSAATVYRMRAYLIDIEDDADVMRALRDVLGDVRPAATAVAISAIAREGALIELELEALSEAPDDGLS
jgi:enamine deaminase RidA (YjgF/YER057c/UK114 family)